MDVSDDEIDVNIGLSDLNKDDQENFFIMDGIQALPTAEALEPQVQQTAYEQHTSTPTNLGNESLRDVKLESNERNHWHSSEDAMSFLQNSVIYLPQSTKEPNILESNNSVTIPNPLEASSEDLKKNQMKELHLVQNKPMNQNKTVTLVQSLRQYRRAEALRDCRTSVSTWEVSKTVSNEKASTSNLSNATSPVDTVSTQDINHFGSSEKLGPLPTKSSSSETKSVVTTETSSEAIRASAANNTTPSLDVSYNNKRISSASNCILPPSATQTSAASSNVLSLPNMPTKLFSAQEIVHTNTQTKGQAEVASIAELLPVEKSTTFKFHQTRSGEKVESSLTITKVKAANIISKSTEIQKCPLEVTVLQRSPKNLTQMTTNQNGKTDTEIAVVKEKRLNDKFKDLVPHTIEESASDSDVCIVKEDIKVPFKRRRAHARRPAYKCSECSFRSFSMERLRQHETAHPKGRKIKCSKCPFETRIKSCMMYHATIHSGGKKFRCSKCKFQTDDLDRFMIHENKKVNCRICKAVFHLDKELRAHMETHTVKVDTAMAIVPDPSSSKSKSLQCKTLAKHKSAKKGPPNHSNAKKDPSSHSNAKKTPSSHSNVKPNPKRVPKDPCFRCHICKFKSETNRGLATHITFKHKVKAKPASKKRHKSSAKKDSNILGKRVIYDAKEREFLCVDCGYVTDERLFMEKHVKIHKGEKDTFSSPEKQIFKCIICDFETEYGRMMQEHMSTHSQSDSDFDMEGEGEIASGDSLEKLEKYWCDNCTYKTNNEKLYNKHKACYLRQMAFNTIFNSLLSK